MVYHSSTIQPWFDVALPSSTSAWHGLQAAVCGRVAPAGLVVWGARKRHDDHDLCPERSRLPPLGADLLAWVPVAAGARQHRARHNLGIGAGRAERLRRRDRGPWPHQPHGVGVRAGRASRHYRAGRHRPAGGPGRAAADGLRPAHREFGRRARPAGRGVPPQLRHQRLRLLLPHRAGGHDRADPAGARPGHPVHREWRRGAARKCDHHLDAREPDRRNQPQWWGAPVRQGRQALRCRGREQQGRQRGESGQSPRQDPPAQRRWHDSRRQSHNVRRGHGEHRQRRPCHLGHRAAQPLHLRVPPPHRPDDHQRCRGKDLRGAEPWRRGGQLWLAERPKV